MQFRLDRSISIPLAEQIGGQIAYAISYGYLRSGEALPSVRELSGTLHVAPMTITQAYRDLAQQGLVVSRPGVGTFVADIARVDDQQGLPTRRGGLLELVDTCVRQAQNMGYGADEIRSTFLSCLQRQTAGSGKVLVVGNFRAATESYAREIAGIWRDLHVEVVPVIIQEMAAAEPARMQALLAGVKFAIAVPTRLKQVRHLLEPRSCRVVAVAFTVSAETRRCLAALDPAQRVGIVSTYPEFLQTIVDNVAAYALLKTLPTAVTLEQQERIRQMVQSIDVLIYASGSDSVCNWVPDHVQAIEYRHSPEPDSVNRLRPLLGNEDAVLPVGLQAVGPARVR